MVELKLKKKGPAPKPTLKKKAPKADGPKLKRKPWTVTKGAKPEPKPAPKDKPKTVSLAVVQPTGDEDKNGCRWCPLAPMASDWDKLAGDYQRDADKIMDALKEPHEVKHRRIIEEWTEVDVLFVGDAPSKDEDSKGEPMVGRVGSVVRRAAQNVMDIPEDRIGYTHLVRCRAPLGKDPSKTIINSCAPDLIREIKARKPKVIVAIGNGPLEFLTTQKGITILAGKALKSTHPAIPETDVVACLTPGYVMRMDHEIDRFAESFELAEKLVKGEAKLPPGAGEYHVLDEVDEVIALMEKFILQGTTVAFDTETGSLSPFDTRFPQLLCFSFSDEEQVGYTIPFDHMDSPWADDNRLRSWWTEEIEELEERYEEIDNKKTKAAKIVQKRLKVLQARLTALDSRDPDWAENREKVADALREFFASDVPKIAQNEKFDRKHIKHALGVDPENVVRDTMLTHLVLEDKRGTHGLKTLAFAYTGMGGYEKPLDDYISKHPEADPRGHGGSYAEIPGDILFYYAGMDTDVTIRVDNGLRKEPTYTGKLKNLAECFFPRLSRSLADMEYRGAQIDPAVVSMLDKQYAGDMAEAADEISKVHEVKAYEIDRIKTGKKGDSNGGSFQFNPGSTTQLRDVFFSYMKEKPLELTDGGLALLAARWERYQNEENEKADKLLAEAKELKKAGKIIKVPRITPEEVNFEDVIKEAYQKGEWHVFSTKADVLQDYKNKGNTLAPLILKYRSAATLHGTFVKPLKHKLDPDARIHGTFLVHGTVTGRLSSADPNLQNIPNKGGGLIKQAYVSRFGAHGVLMQADYSQIELRVAACWYGEPTMIEAYQNGEDLHTLTAIAISGMTAKQYAALPKDEAKAWRTRAKRVNFGVLYGGGPPALQRALQQDGVFLTTEECEELIQRFFEARPGLKAGIEATQEFALQHGYLESFTGRLRRLPEVASESRELRERALRQSINFPIQSGAADMTLMALTLINEHLKAEGYESMAVLTVHDSIIFDCHVDEAMDVARITKYIMEHLPELVDDLMPGLEWDWLQVPVVAECEMGRSWGQLVEFDPDLIDDDVEPETELFGEDEDGKVKAVRAPETTDELWELMERAAA